MPPKQLLKVKTWSDCNLLHLVLVFASNAWRIQCKASLKGQGGHWICHHAIFGYSKKILSLFFKSCWWFWCKSLGKTICLQTPIYARAIDLEHLLDLKKAGATDAILENAEVFNFHIYCYLWQGNFLQCFLDVLTKILFIDADKFATGL